jgi:hypothetical protein
MSPLSELDESKLVEQLFPMFTRFEEDIEKAQPLFEMQGQRLEVMARTLPHNQAFYDQRYREARQLVKWLENHMARIEARLTKNYLQGQRAYGARETAALIAGEREMVEHKQLIIEASIIQEKLDAIVEGFKQMGWMVQNITKLRIAELHDVVL